MAAAADEDLAELEENFPDRSMQVWGITCTEIARKGSGKENQARETKETRRLREINQNMHERYRKGTSYQRENGVL